MPKFTLSAFVAATLAVSGIATAQQAAPADAKDGPLAKYGIDFSGYADISYNHLNRTNLFTSGVPNRVFDLQQDGFALQQVAFTLAKQPKEGMGGLLNVTVGKDADVIAAYGTDPQKGRLCNVATGLNTDGSGSRCDRDRFDVTQAFAQYANGPLTVMGGKYVTYAGAEVIQSTANPNFSRSILFGYAIPFTHTGVRAYYDITDTFQLMGGVNQGWDDLKDTNSTKAYEVGFNYMPTKALSIHPMFHSGKERVGGLVGAGPEGSRNLFDLVVTFNATDKLTFIVNYDRGSQANTTGLVPSGASTAVWLGLAGYVNYQFNDQWKLSFRAEEFSDKDGYRTGVVQKWKEATLTLGWLPTKAIELRGEVRRDKSDVASFVDINGINVHNNMTSYGLQFLYKF